MKIYRPLIAACLLWPGAMASVAAGSSEVSCSGLWLAVHPALEQPCSAAISDFRDYYQKITGHALAAGAGENPVALKLELTTKDATDETYLGRARVGDYEIAVTENEVVIRGKSPLAITNGLYGLLDIWGCRWPFPGELGAVIPNNPNVSLPLGERKFQIASDSRILAGPPSYYQEGEVGDWVRRNRFGKESTVTAHHSWASLIVPSFVYNDPTKPETYHPEYFSLIGGKRATGTDSHKLQICTTNPEVIRMGVAVAKKYLRENPLVDTFPCSPEDNFEFCQCDACLAQDTGALTPEGVPDVSDRVMAFVNEIARGIRDEFPNKLVGVYAYNNYTRPPTKVLPEKNVMLDVTRMNYDLLRLIPRNEGDSSARFAALVESWRKLTPYIYIYEYNPIYWSGGLPSPNYVEYADAIRYYRDRGVLGFRSDPGELPFRNKVNFLNDYLALRVAVDADLDPKKELAATTEALFGPAGAAMTKYYEILARVTDQTPVPTSFLGGGVRHFHKMFTPEMMKQATAALAEARQSIGPDAADRKRLRMAEVSHLYLTNYLDVIQSAQAGDYPKSVKALSNLERTIDTLGADKVFDPTGRLTVLRGAALMAQAEYCPEAAGFVQNWKLLGPFDNSDRSGEIKLASFEPVLDFKSSVKSDGLELHWQDYRSSTGFLEFYKAFPSRPKDWSASTVYAATSFQAEKAGKVKLELNSFNSFRAYLNGQEVFFRPGQQMDLPDTYKVEVELKAGKNELVFRCTETAQGDNFPWGLYLRVINAEGQVLPPNAIAKIN